ncbi:MAG: flagellar biosynthesis protein FlhB [Gammaproteobacteria bacterium]
MAEQTAQEKTERATPKRLREAREKGQLARSRDLNSTILLLAASGGLLVFGDSLLAGLAGQMRMSFSLERATVFEPLALQMYFGKALGGALLAFGPFLGLLFVAALLAPMSLGGWAFSPQAVVPKWSKLNPLKGFGRMFAVRSLVEAMKAFAKFLVVAIASGILLYQSAGELFALGDEPLHQALAHTAHVVGWSFVAMSAVLILIAAVDVPFQLWDHANKMKMSKQEIKDETRQTEGSPEVKGRIRAIQRQQAQQRMMEDVPTADVVVTNPTHYAVALRYDQESAAAPKVVAMGADLVAARIRDLAREHDVTVVEAPPLARALYFNAEIGHEIPAGLYMAVAQLLAYVYQLKAVRRPGQPEPELPEALPVPDELLRTH